MASVILWTISSARPTEVSGATSGDNDDTISLLPVRLTSAIYLIFEKFCRYSCHINNRTVVFRTTPSPHHGREQSLCPHPRPPTTATTHFTTRTTRHVCTHSATSRSSSEI